MMLSGYNVRISDYIKKHRGDFIAFSIALIFSVIFSIFSIRQYYSLGTSAYDLGINAQELYSFIHTGSFYTPLLNENALSQHFTIFKFLQLPFYYAFPSPITIMVLENIFIAMAGYIVYLLSMILLKDHIKSVRILFLLSIGFLLSYEFSPFSESLVSFPFHNMAFLPFFFLLAFYAFLTERRVLHIVSIVFIILIISLPYGILSSPGAQLTSHGSQMNNIYKEVPDGSAVFLMNLSESFSPRLHPRFFKIYGYNHRCCYRI